MPRGQCLEVGREVLASEGVEGSPVLAEDDIDLAIAYYAIRGFVDDMIYLEEEGLVSFAKPSSPFIVDFDSAASEATVSVAWAYDVGTVCSHAVHDASCNGPYTLLF